MSGFIHKNAKRTEKDYRKAIKKYCTVLIYVSLFLSVWEVTKYLILQHSIAMQIIVYVNKDFTKINKFIEKYVFLFISI
jgi:hypothetical protein